MLLFVGDQPSSNEPKAPNPVVQALKQQASLARVDSSEDPDDDGEAYARIMKTRQTFRILSTRNTTTLGD